MTCHVHKCCGFVDLKTGSFIIGYLNLVWNVIIIVTALAFAILSLDSLNESRYGMFYDEEKNRVFTVVLWISCAIFIFALIGLVFGIFLVIGLHQSKPGKLMAYLIFSTVFSLLYVIGFILTCFTVPIIAAIFFVVILLQVYCLLVIRSMYSKMMLNCDGHQLLLHEAV